MNCGILLLSWALYWGEKGMASRTERDRLGIALSVLPGMDIGVNSRGALV